MTQQNNVIHPRITNEQLKWLKIESERTESYSMASVIRRLIQEQINKCNAQDLKWCAWCGKHGDHTSGQCPDLARRKEASNEKQNS